jgi:hypothetical protein
VTDESHLVIVQRVDPAVDNGRQVGVLSGARSIQRALRLGWGNGAAAEVSVRTDGRLGDSGAVRIPPEYRGEAGDRAPRAAHNRVMELTFL